ncbi:carbohydrate ABC transporter permease [Lachnoclostridium sp. Marseille-P6806]|uniref:carbohydrate ABC transporter permease n=1 Tax=Lachnoclostridium sp. Marseille-P6806 TaxID=2364793 RepID=UPI001030A91B|nr:carbohydrate ABC transporter permease [Lachnoclostridium sp. Marseille-P6806]
MKQKWKDKTISDYRTGRGTRICKDMISLVMVLYSFITIFLIAVTVTNSFKTKTELIRNITGWPQKPTLENYVTVFVEEKFWRYILNSVCLVGVALILMIAVSSLLAYGVAQYDFRGKGFLQGYFLVGLMVPVQLTILPLYLMLSKAGLANIYGLMIIYAANFSFAFTIFTRFFEEFPVAVIESARIDGAGDLTIFAGIIVPVSKSVFFTVGLLQFIMVWNDFFLPMVFIQKKSAYTLTLAIYEYTCNFLKNWDKIFSAVTVALIPILIIYFLFSEQIVSGLTGGSVKE